MYGQALCWPEFHHSLGSGFPPLWRLSVGSFPEHWLVMEPNPVSRVACEGNVSRGVFCFPYFGCVRSEKCTNGNVSCAGLTRVQIEPAWCQLFKGIVVLLPQITVPGCSRTFRFYTILHCLEGI